MMPGPVNQRRVVHHLVQGAGLDLVHEPDGLAVPAGGVRLEPVTETDPREVPVGELGRDAPPQPAPDDEHFGVRGPVEVGARPPGRQRVTGLHAVADCLDGPLVEPRPPAVGEGLARFCAGAFRQDRRLTGLRRHPPAAEGVFDLGALPLKFWIAVLARSHARMVAAPSRRRFTSRDRHRAKSPARRDSQMDQPLFRRKERRFLAGPCAS